MTYMLGDNVGFAFADEADRKQFAKSHAKAWEKLTGHGCMLQRLMVGDDLQYYTYKPKAGKREFAMHYLSDTRTEVQYADVRDATGEDSPFGMHQLNYTGQWQGQYVAGCMVVQIPDACLRDLQKGWYLMQIAAFCGQVLLSRNPEEFRQLKSPYPPEVIMPLFRRPDEDSDEEAVFTGRMLLSGYVEAYELRTNMETGLPYHWVRLRCLSQHIDVLLAPDALPPEGARAGDIITTVAQTMSARPIQWLGEREDA